MDNPDKPPGCFGPIQTRGVGVRKERLRQRGLEKFPSNPPNRAVGCGV
jgi:hypothetical protein